MHRLHLRRAITSEGAFARPRPGSPLNLPAALVAAALVLGACSGSSSDVPSDLPAAADDPIGDPADDRAEAGPALGDPADEGYAPVEDPVADVAGPDPAADTESGSNDDAPADPVIPGAVDEVVDEVADQLADAEPGDEILDSVEILDRADDGPKDQEGGSRNSSGEPVTLDEAAGLACANAEIAIGLIDDGEPGIALERIATAARHAAQSDLSAIREWSQPLSAVRATGAGSDDEAASLAPLVRFLAACTERGYEL